MKKPTIPIEIKWILQILDIIRQIFLQLEKPQQIIQEIIPLLQAKNIKLYLKLHPDDKKSDYDQYHLDYLTDYNDAIIGNICFARKSTVLLEALYNHSIPLAILINSKDMSIYSTFPSLNQDKIKVTYSVSDLADEIIKNLKWRSC